MRTFTYYLDPQTRCDNFYIGGITEWGRGGIPPPVAVGNQKRPVRIRLKVGSVGVLNCPPPARPLSYLKAQWVTSLWVRLRIKE